MQLEIPHENAAEDGALCVWSVVPMGKAGKMDTYTGQDD